MFERAVTDLFDGLLKILGCAIEGWDIIKSENVYRV